MIHFIDTILQPWVWTLVDWSVRWAVLIGLLAAVLRWGRPKRTATRYLLCCVVLCVGILLPALPRWGPGLWPSARVTPPAEQPASHGTAEEVAITAMPPADTAAAPPTPSTALGPAERRSEVQRAMVPAPERVERESLGTGRIVLVALAAAWCAGVGVFLLRLAGGWLVLARIRHGAIPVDGAARDLFEESCRRLGRCRRTAFAMHSRVTSPITLGPWRPTVLVPTGWEQLPAATQRSSIVHELWHVRRRDDWTGLAVELVRAAFFFHPLVHWLVGRLYRERELLCDEAAVAHGAEPRDYARMLLAFARQPALSPFSGGARCIATLPTTPLGDRRTVKHRIDRLLDENASRWMAPLPRGRAVFVTSLALLVSAGIASIRAYGSPVIESRTRSATGTAVEQRTQVLPAENPDLATLIEALARHERAMEKVRLDVLLTFRPNAELSEKERTFFPWADGRKHQRRIELARDVAKNRWYRKEAFLVDATRTQQFDQYSDGERQLTATQTSWNGLNPPSAQIAKEPEPASLAPDVTMLDGLFPTRRSLAAELSKAEKVDVGWDGDDARLSFTSSQHGYGKFTVWLSRRHDWYPKRVQCYFGRDGELIYDWKVLEFAESAGVVYPKRGAGEPHDPRVEGKSAYTLEFEVVDLATATPLPVELFRYAIPAGAWVHDDAAGKSYIQGRAAPTEKKDFVLAVLDVLGNPIPEATAALSPTESYPDRPEVAEMIGKTDADGVALFRDVFKADYRLTIDHPSYRPALWIVGPESESLRAYVLPKTQGVAVDDEGKPVPGAHVTSELMFSARGDGGPLLNPPLPNRNTELADENGRFELVTEQTIRSPDRPVLLAAYDAEASLMAIRFVTPADLRKPLKLTLSPTCRVRTIVELPGANPDEVGSISIAWADGEGREFAAYGTAVSKLPDGGLRAEALARIPPGSYQLTFGRTALSEPVSVRFEVKPGETEKDLGTWSLRPSVAASLRGAPAPELAVQAWRPGGAKRLEDLRGNVVVLDFWGYWCVPCIAQMPGLMDLAEKFKDRPVRWIAVHDGSVNEFEELDAKLADIRERLWKGRRLPFDSAIDQPLGDGHDRGVGVTADRYGVKLWPTLVVIDRAGNLVGAVSKDRLEAELERLLSGVSTAPH